MHELTLTNKKCVLKKNTLFIDNLVANFSNLVSISDLGSIIKKNVYSKMYFKCTVYAKYATNTFTYVLNKNITKCNKNTMQLYFWYTKLACLRFSKLEELIVMYFKLC